MRVYDIIRYNTRHIRLTCLFTSCDIDNIYYTVLRCGIRVVSGLKSRSRGTYFFRLGSIGICRNACFDFVVPIRIRFGHEVNDNNATINRNDVQSRRQSSEKRAMTVVWARVKLFLLGWSDYVDHDARVILFYCVRGVQGIFSTVLRIKPRYIASSGTRTQCEALKR